MSSDEHLILTTPPVHGGPEFGETMIEGAGNAARVGLASRIRDIVEETGMQAASRTSLPVVIPTKELVSAFTRFFSDVPRIPDYDAVAAHAARWVELVYNPLEVPDSEPDSLGVFVREMGPDAGKVCVELTRPADGTTTTLDFDPDSIESFGLAVLAACAYARTQR